MNVHNKPLAWVRRCNVHGITNAQVGRPKKKLKSWVGYAKDASFDPSASRRGGKRDLAPCGNHGAETNYPDDKKIVADQTDQGDGWEHYSDLSRTNSYTRQGRL